MNFPFFAPKRKPLGGLAGSTGPTREASIKNETFCDILLATRPKKRERDKQNFNRKKPILHSWNPFGNNFLYEFVGRDNRKTIGA